MTGKSSKNRVVLAATTVLYVLNVIGGLKLWEDISLLIGTSGNSMSQSLFGESTAFTDNIVWSDVTKFLPFIVADGLLVRCLWNFPYTLTSSDSFADMAVLQNLEWLISNYRTVLAALLGRDW